MLSMLHLSAESVRLLEQCVCLQEEVIKLCFGLILHGLLVLCKQLLLIFHFLLILLIVSLQLSHRYALQTLGNLANGVGCNVEHALVLIVGGVRLAASLYPSHQLIVLEFEASSLGFDLVSGLLKLGILS